jgi:hypothetical protein
MGRVVESCCGLGGFFLFVVWLYWCVCLWGDCFFGFSVCVFLLLVFFFFVWVFFYEVVDLIIMYDVV